MSKDKKMPKEYAIVISLIIFFTIITVVGSIRLYAIASIGRDTLELYELKADNIDTNIDLSSFNIRLANSIRRTYGIDVYFGNISGLDSVNAVALTDDTVIFDMLKHINAVLEKYPNNLVNEIESKGYELSIYLVDYFTINVEAIANRNSIGQMKIYMSNTTDIERALHHEYYHLLDYYIKLETDENLAYLNWEKYNPKGFSYSQNIDNITTKYVYYGEPGANFVTAYAKYSEKEDRAETFAEMMTAPRSEVFFNETEPIRGKINTIREVLYNTFKCVRDEQSLAWL